MSSGHANPIKAILLALGANFAIFVAKLFAAIVTGSGAMMAEAVHSLADCGNQGLLLLGIRQAKRPPSDEFPLGWGRALYFWSFLVAILLFSVGGMFSIYEGVHKLTNPEPLDYPAGALMTVSGKLNGSRAGQVGQANYVFPLVTAAQSHVWTTEELNKGRNNVHFGLGVGVGIH